MFFEVVDGYGLHLLTLRTSPIIVEISFVANFRFMCFRAYFLAYSMEWGYFQRVFLNNSSNFQYIWMWLTAMDWILWYLTFSVMVGSVTGISVYLIALLQGNYSNTCTTTAASFITGILEVPMSSEMCRISPQVFRRKLISKLCAVPPLPLGDHCISSMKCSAIYECHSIAYFRLAQWNGIHMKCSSPEHPNAKQPERV